MCVGGGGLLTPHTELTRRPRTRGEGLVCLFTCYLSALRGDQGSNKIYVNQLHGNQLLSASRFPLAAIRKSKWNRLSAYSFRGITAWGLQFHRLWDGYLHQQIAGHNSLERAFFPLGRLPIRFSYILSLQSRTCLD